jgi:hypothetical protein
MVRFATVLLRQIAPLFGLGLLASCVGFPSGVPTAPTYVPDPPHPIAIEGELAFGDVVIGQSRVLTVTFRNTSNSPLILPPPGASINFAGLLSMTPPPARLEPGEATAFQLRFTPVAVGTVSGTFSVSAQNVNGRDIQGRASAPISGTGVAPR